MAKIKVKELAAELLTDFLAENGLELYNVEYVKEGKDWFLRVYIEKPEGAEAEYVSTDDCELVSRFLSDRLDEEDPIEQNYYLEVSSPGLDRAFIKEDDYRRFAGRLVDVSLYKAFEGSKSYTEAKLIGLSDGILKIEPAAGQPLDIPFEQVSKVKLSVIF